MDPHPVSFRRQPLVRFLACVRPQLKLVVAAALMGVGKFTLPLAFPFAFKYVVDVLLSSPPKADRVDRIIDGWCSGVASLIGLSATAQGKLAALSLVMLLIYVLQSAVSYFRNYWAGIAGNRLIFGLRSQLYSHLQRLPHSFFDRHPAGAIVSRVLNDVTQASELVNSTLIDVWTDASLLGLVIFALFELNWKLALISLCIAPLWVGFMRFFAPRIKAVSHRMQEAVEVISGEVHERVVGATTVKSFGREDHEVGVFNDRNEDPVRPHHRQGEAGLGAGDAHPVAHALCTGGSGLGRRRDDHQGRDDARHPDGVLHPARIPVSTLGALRAAFNRRVGLDRRDRANL